MIAKSAYVGAPPPRGADEQIATAAMDHHASVRALLQALPAARHRADAVVVLSADGAATVALHRVERLRPSHRLDRWRVWRPVEASDGGASAASGVSPAFVERVARRGTALDWDACVAALIDGCALGLLDLSRVEDRALAIRILLGHACRPVQVARTARAAPDGGRAGTA